MARPKQYSSDAERQAAYRQRKADKAADQRMKALPASPGIPNIAARRRWNALLERAQVDLQTAAEEMQSYFDDRSEEWQESEKAEELQAQIDELEDILANLADLLSE